MRAKKIVIVMILCITLLSCVLCVCLIGRNGATDGRAGFGMFSWNEDAILPEEADRLTKTLHQAGVEEIYQYVPLADFGEDTISDFLSRMDAEHVAVYALTGEASWAYDTDAKELKKRIEEIAGYNERNAKKAGFAGIMVDVEPYLLEEWDAGTTDRKALMECYLACMEEAYAFAAARKLKFMVCIPTFYDVTNPEVLEQLIEQGCDGVAVMNYNRTDEYGQMLTEVELARESAKDIVCIYELQKSGTHDLEPIHTYAGTGLEVLWGSASALKRQFDYAHLRFAYHYYEPLKEMLPK